ncbi:AAA family ATPase [Gloeothece verrucosa]|uniref:ATPase-like protein n=1 Tax=Gloeothece verrucosa (strain PCC 7822) TaxID=497965 RepID=E0UCU0_GLOV7|nr:AAA family ATPase [Gloeothece verrucosa]ADN15284.1 ATPase-like protein [Gloeothece verrucosa PCC 7822]
MLSFLYLQNYKNLALPDKLELKNLNIFIGSNGSGKSNLINCLKFLKDCLTTVPEQSRGVSSFEDAIYKIGGDRILDRNILSPAQLRLVYGFNISDNRILDLKIFCSDKRVSISEEFLYRGDTFYENYNNSEPFYYYKFHNKEVNQGVISVYNPEEKRTRFEVLTNISNKILGLAAISSLLEDSPFPPTNTPVYKIRQEIVETVSKWQFYNANNMNLNLIRTSEPKLGLSDIYLSPSGDNLPLVLDNLSYKIDFEDKINLAVKSILPTTRRVRAIRSGQLSLTVEWYFDGINEPFYLNEMSDGTVRMLCWATILFSPHLPSLLVIDEPELGLHVAWMPILAEWIKEAATKTQIIITTHSPDLLDHFTDSLENVFCFYGSDKSHFSVTNLSKDMLDTKLDEGWQLGDLYRVGDPSVGGWPW